ncbi:Ff.00g021870.m01.CDS01 [Fusarium sp. VM40]|nr:Ff.00g021870.m01.CDS01 [Fusarium sp. VM40]
MLPIDGLLAILIYLDKTKLFADPQIIQSHKHWGFVQHIRFALDWYRERLISVTLTQELPGLEALLRSFPTPMSFYEAAIFTFRNTLTGPKPESLDAVIALCIFSHVTLSYLRQLHGSVDCDLSFDSNVWRDTIQDLEHRQTFSRLIEILFPETLPLVSCHASQLLPPAGVLDLPSSTPHQNEAAEALPPTIFTIEDDLAIYDMLDSFLGCSDAVDAYPATPSSHAMVGVGTAHHTSSLADLQGSAIMLNITRFLEECGESMLIFSGRGLTAKDLRSCVAFNQQGFATKNLITTSFIQPLRKYDICKEPSISGILSIVDRFVDLGYLQTIGEVRDYMLFVGREVLASDQTFPEFCQTVCAIIRTDTDTGGMPVPPLRPGRRGGLRKPARKK